jgi:hypothetical protein
MRTTYREGGGFEEAAAYSRAVRIGQHVAISGTARREPGDAYFVSGFIPEGALVEVELDAIVPGPPR